MRPTQVRSLGFVVLLMFVQSAMAQNRFILHAPVASAAALVLNHNLTFLSAPDTHGIAIVQSTDARTVGQVVAELSADPAVLGIEPDSSALVSEAAPGAVVNQSTAAILDALAGRKLVSYFGTLVWGSYVNQPATNLINLGESQELSTGRGVTVAVIDTGVDPSQPVLSGVLVPGYDFIHQIAGIASELSDLDPATVGILNQAEASASDRNTPVQVNQSTAAILDQSTAAILDTSQLPAAFGHGTMIAGIIHLVTPNVQIMPLKAFTDDGSANMSDIVRAVYFAVDNGARVINMSFSSTTVSVELMKALNYASAHDVISVASVGNGGLETVVYPAAFKNTIGVASTNSFDVRSTFSNYGAAMTLMAAPGEGIVTVYPGGAYAVVSGTSFSAPFVAGGAAQMIQVDHDIDSNESCTSFYKAKKLTPDLGYGRLDLYQALQSVVAQYGYH